MLLQSPITSTIKRILQNLRLLTNDNNIFVGTIGKSKCSPGSKKKKKSLSALGNCWASSTLPQINLDVLHPSGDYMESWPVINSLCGDDDRAGANLHERIEKMAPGSHPPTPWAPFPTSAHPLPSALKHPRSLSGSPSPSLSALTGLSRSLPLPHPLFSPWVSR